MGSAPARRVDWRWRVVIALIVPLVRLGRWRLDIRGLENVPAQGSAILAFNHHSYTDAIMLAWGPVLRLHRPVRFLAKREICDSRWIGWVPRFVAAICVDRGSTGARAGALSAAEDALRSGDLVAIAPEQTISESLDLLPFRHGVARLSLATGAPIVPTVGWGSQRFLAKGATSGRRRLFGLPVTVRFMPPILPEEGESPAGLTERLRIAVQAGLDEVQATYPDGLPAGAAWVPARLGGGARPHAEVLAAHEARVRAWRDLPGDAPGGGTEPGS